MRNNNIILLVCGTGNAGKSTWIDKLMSKYPTINNRSIYNISLDSFRSSNSIKTTPFVEDPYVDSAREKIVSTIYDYNSTKMNSIIIIDYPSWSVKGREKIAKKLNGLNIDFICVDLCPSLTKFIERVLKRTSVLSSQILNQLHITSYEIATEEEFKNYGWNTVKVFNIQNDEPIEETKFDYLINYLNELDKNDR